VNIPLKMVEKPYFLQEGMIVSCFMQKRKCP
jgi:hypothetical protein